jgi:cytochrome c oxidase cbb3-type subunit III
MKSYLKNIALYTAVILGTTTAVAQDGAQLFKAKCNTCHMVDKNSTGPLLKGVKQKWNDAGEGEFLYEWVKNPQTLSLPEKVRSQWNQRISVRLT